MVLWKDKNHKLSVIVRIGPIRQAFMASICAYKLYFDILSNYYSFSSQSLGKSVPLELKTSWLYHENQPLAQKFNDM